MVTGVSLSGFSVLQNELHHGAWPARKLKPHCVAVLIPADLRLEQVAEHCLLQILDPEFRDPDPCREISQRHLNILFIVHMPVRIEIRRADLEGLLRLYILSRRLYMALKPRFVARTLKGCFDCTFSVGVFIWR